MNNFKETLLPGVSPEIFAREFQSPLELDKHVCSHMYFNPLWTNLGCKKRMLALEESPMRDHSCPTLLAQKLRPRERSGLLK